MRPMRQFGWRRTLNMPSSRSQAGSVAVVYKMFDQWDCCIGCAPAMRGLQDRNAHRHRQILRIHALRAKTWRSCREIWRRFDSNIPPQTTKPAVHGAVGAFFRAAPYNRAFSSWMSTMNRCPTTRSAGPIGLAARAWLAGLVLAWWGAALPAAEQLQPA